jgi:hypothetical protein
MKRGIMNRKTIIFIAVIFFFAADFQAFAGYYTIRLKNGKELAVNKYWNDGSKIRFYRDGGSVAIAKEDIRTIEKQDGAAPAAEPLGADSAAVPEVTENEGEQNITPPPAPAAIPKEDGQAEIKERLSIIQANIAALLERKKSYLNQKNNAQAEKVSAEQRIEKYRADTYMPSEDRKRSIAGEEQKINAVGIQIQEADRQVNAVEEMIGNQEAIKKSLEDKLQQR